MSPYDEHHGMTFPEGIGRFHFVHCFHFVHFIRDKIGFDDIYKVCSKIMAKFGNCDGVSVIVSKDNHKKMISEMRYGAPRDYIYSQLSMNIPYGQVRINECKYMPDNVSMIEKEGHGYCATVITTSELQ